MAFKSGIKRDLQGERKAIRDYTSRIGQAKTPSQRSNLREIKGDEQDHEKRLTKIIKGLQDYKPE